MGVMEFLLRYLLSLHLVMLKNIMRFRALVDENYFDIALGMAVGRKWINRKGFTLETLFGVGRNLFFDEESDSGDRLFVKS